MAWGNQAYELVLISSLARFVYELAEIPVITVVRNGEANSHLVRVNSSNPRFKSRCVLCHLSAHRVANDATVFPIDFRQRVIQQLVGIPRPFAETGAIRTPQLEVGNGGWWM